MKATSLKSAAAAALILGSTFAAVSANAADLVVNAVSPTSDDYALSVTWSNILAKSGSDSSMTVVDNGTVKGLRKLAKGQVDVAVIGAPHYQDAVNRSGKFKADPESLVSNYKNVRALFAIKTSAGQYVARDDAGVKQFGDFAGKSLAIGRPGGNAGRVTAAMLSAHGLDIKGGDVDGQHLKYGPALEQMANGSMDGTFVWGGLPHAAVDNASRTMDLRFVSPDPSKMDTFRKAITNGKYYVLKKVPAKTIAKAYDGRVKADSDIYFWTFPMMYVVNKDLSNDVAYEITKALWENISEVNEVSLALSLISIDGATEALSADLHPGAARYFKEKGLIN
ncbi:TAXI family TRAP transporter solute-binding subunit [Grimontia kaedaensis]|uniref:TAXI family TRAP transporter solute-binding subunit n=1 Tax=Grimontia kaedaensis TaxID=2872157 RepID=A0ABY4WWG3_9GAMM|nr:TAXI family TRAP transporter solute-binding subunit [Grimontia kaedaensis]USH03499.1 TAXI family TRAP transporter solute-binding subunit [Grimontia kaedaensis]